MFSDIIMKEMYVTSDRQRGMICKPTYVRNLSIYYAKITAYFSRYWI